MIKKYRNVYGLKTVHFSHSFFSLKLDGSNPEEDKIRESEMDCFEPTNDLVLPLKVGQDMNKCYF